MKGETFNRFYFGERSSREFGLTIERKSILDGAKPDMQEYSVPGQAEDIGLAKSNSIAIYDGRRFIGVGPPTSGKAPLVYGEPGRWTTAEIEISANPVGLCYGNGIYVLHLRDGRIFTAKGTDLRLVTPGGADMTEMVRAALGHT